MGLRNSKPINTPTPTIQPPTNPHSKLPPNPSNSSSPHSPKSHKHPPTHSIYVDHGTGETKVYKIGLLGTTPEITELALYPSLEEECSKSIYTDRLPQQTQIEQLINTHQPVKVFVGTTAWSRTASQQIKDRVQLYFSQLSTSTTIPTECRVLTGEEESSYEATAVQFAANATGLPDINIILSSGGGSLQISLAIPGENSHWFNCSLDIGFRTGIAVLNNQSLGSYSQRLDHWRTLVLAEMSKIGPMIPDILIKLIPTLNIVAISACYYASKVAGIDRHYVDIDTAIQQLPQELGIEPDEKTIKNVVNSVIQTELFRAIQTRTNKPTNIHFSRDWKIEGVDFRTTWCAGKYLTDNALDH